jgi:hypothetical protein
VTGVHIHTVTDRNVLQKSVFEKNVGQAVKIQSRKKFQVPRAELPKLESCGVQCHVGCYAMLAAMPCWLLEHRCFERPQFLHLRGQADRQIAHPLDYEYEGSIILLNVGNTAQINTAQQIRRLESPDFKI